MAQPWFAMVYSKFSKSKISGVGGPSTAGEASRRDKVSHYISAWMHLGASENSSPWFASKRSQVGRPKSEELQNGRLAVICRDKVWDDARSKAVQNKQGKRNNFQ